MALIEFLDESIGRGKGIRLMEKYGPHGIHQAIGKADRALEMIEDIGLGAVCYYVPDCPECLKTMVDSPLFIIATVYRGAFSPPEAFRGALEMTV